jgi:hypothetical protein
VIAFESSLAGIVPPHDTFNGTEKSLEAVLSECCDLDLCLADD